MSLVNFMFLQDFYQQETIKNYQNFIAKDLKVDFIGMNIKEKVRTKLRQMCLDILSNQILVEPIDYLFQFILTQILLLKAKRYYSPKVIIDNYDVIVSGKSFYDRAIESDIKRYQDDRKLTTGQVKAIQLDVYQIMNISQINKGLQLFI